MIEANIIHAAYLNKVTKLLFLGSSCIYPKMAPQPLKEEYLLTGLLEETNEPYAIAKIAGIKMCGSYKRQYGCNFISVMPTNMYGPNDSYNLNNSHVLPALIRKFHNAKESNLPSVEMWGTGLPMREFLHADDLGDACVFLMNNYDGEQFVNIGSGKDLTIKDLALLIKNIVGFKGEIIWDKTKPDGTARKLLDVSKINKLGWLSKIDLNLGIKKTVLEFLNIYFWNQISEFLCMKYNKSLKKNIKGINIGSFVYRLFCGGRLSRGLGDPYPPPRLSGLRGRSLRLGAPPEASPVVSSRG